jgi:hypothetical protein
VICTSQFYRNPIVSISSVVDVVAMTICASTGHNARIIVLMCVKVLAVICFSVMAERMLCCLSILSCDLVVRRQLWRRCRISLLGTTCTCTRTPCTPPHPHTPPLTSHHTHTPTATRTHTGSINTASATRHTCTTAAALTHGSRGC